MYPFRSHGFLINQPFGTLVLTVLPARILLDTAYSDRLKAVPQPNGTYRLDGSQRELMARRLKDIGRFIDTGSAAFPNTIILAANYREEDGLIEEEDGRKWSFNEPSEGAVGILEIPQCVKLAPIIDGQHRLFSFNFAENTDRLNMPLACAVYFDLPKPYQASLFATINANQRPVSRSQTYELFGYNIEDESPEKWTPEKLAVFLSRKLNTEEDSPFHRHIVISAENDLAPSLAEARRSGSWAVSTATTVEGIVRLISSNPKVDAYKMAGAVRYEGKDRTVLESAKDPSKTPLRNLYIAKNDDLVYTSVRNYFTAIASTLWRDASPDSYIRKTVGIQALFDVSRALLFEAVQEKDLQVARFKTRLSPATRVDFSDSIFHASGTGRQYIRTSIELCLGLRDLNSVPRDQDQFRRVCKL